MNKKIQELFETADIETKSGNFDKAIEAYEYVLKIPNVSEQAIHLSYWGIGEIYLNNEQYDHAEHYLSLAVELAPYESYYQYLLGCTHTYKNNIDKAIYHLEQAVKLDDSIDIYWGQLGWVIGHNKDADKGIKHLKKALSINPTHPASLRDLCMLYAKKEMFDEAIVCIEEADKNDPDNEFIKNIRAQIEHFKSEFQRFK